MWISYVELWIGFGEVWWSLGCLFLSQYLKRLPIPNYGYASKNHGFLYPHYAKKYIFFGVCF